MCTKIIKNGHKYLYIRIIIGQCQSGVEKIADIECEDLK